LYKKATQNANKKIPPKFPSCNKSAVSMLHPACFLEFKDQQERRDLGNWRETSFLFSIALALPNFLSGCIGVFFCCLIRIHAIARRLLLCSCCAGKLSLHVLAQPSLPSMVPVDPCFLRLARRCGQIPTLR